VAGCVRTAAVTDAGARGSEPLPDRSLRPRQRAERDVASAMIAVRRVVMDQMIGVWGV